MEDILQQVRGAATTSSPPFPRGAGGDHLLNRKLHFPNYGVHTNLSDYVSKFRSPSIPLKKGEEEKEFSSPPFLRGAGGDHLLNHKLHFPNYGVHTNLSDYVSRFRSPSIPLKKGEEEKEFNSPPFLRGAGGDQ
jgi:hypothetical protein